jgi:hypothetical protein
MSLTSVAECLVYDTATGAYTSYTINGKSISTAYVSSASVTPDMYVAQISPVTTGGTKK